MCMCVYTSPIVLLMETQPNPAFDEPFVSWTYMYLKVRRASLFFVRTTSYTDGRTIAHRSRFVCFWGKSKKKKQKKEEKRSPSHRNAPSTVGRDAFLFISSTHVHHANQNLPHSFAFVLIIR